MIYRNTDYSVLYLELTPRENRYADGANFRLFLLQTPEWIPRGYHNGYQILTPKNYVKNRDLCVLEKHHLSNKCILEYILAQRDCKN